jgi:hypothetical protein
MNTIITIFKLIPAIIEAMKAIEAAIPGTGKGEQKLAAIRQMLEMIDSSVGSIWPQISGVIGILVKLFNDTGAFAKNQ